MNLVKLLSKRDQGRDDLLTADDDEDDDEDGNNFIVDDQGNPVRGRRTHGGENMRELVNSERATGSTGMRESTIVIRSARQLRDCSTL